jgi:microcystin-dependent protein
MDPFVGEIRIFTGNFAPKGWAFCNGQIMPIIQNTALFALLGTTYGGDGQTTYALPNLQGRAPLHPGQGNGLSQRVLGESAGAATAALNASEIPAHKHGPLNVHDAPGTSGTPGPAKNFAKAPSNIYGPATSLVAMGDTIGDGAPHQNRQPYLALNFIIALQGIFPSRPQP